MTRPLSMSPTSRVGAPPPAGSATRTLAKDNPRKRSVNEISAICRGDTVPRTHPPAVPVGMHATSAGDQIDPAPLDTPLPRAAQKISPRGAEAMPRAQRPARIATHCPPCLVPMSPTAYRRVTCSLQLLTPPPAISSWPVPLPPAPPPVGVPHPPLPIQTPVFFDLPYRVRLPLSSRGAY